MCEFRFDWYIICSRIFHFTSGVEDRMSVIWEKGVVSPCPQPEYYRQRTDQSMAASQLPTAYRPHTDQLTLSFPRTIKIKFALQPQQKYDITQYEELGFS